MVSGGVSKGSSDWTAASEPRPQYYIPGGGSTQYVILYDPTLTNQIMMNPVTTGGTSSGSLKAIAPAPSTLNQQPEMILSEPQYITQCAPRVMPGGPFAAPSYVRIVNKIINLFLNLVCIYSLFFGKFIEFMKKKEYIFYLKVYIMFPKLA